MLISRIKKQTAPLFLLIYFLFAQVYPYIHVHVHSEENEQHVEFTFHPVDGCQIPHEGMNAHHHECHHFNGDWEHAAQKTEIRNPTLSSHFIIENRIPFYPLQEFQYFNISSVFNSIHHSNFSTLRAPPAIS